MSAPAIEAVCHATLTMTSGAFAVELTDLGRKLPPGRYLLAALAVEPIPQAPAAGEPINPQPEKP